MHHLSFSGTGQVVDKRELTAKENKSNIWRRIIKVAVGDHAAELVVTPDLYVRAAVGEFVEFTGRVISDFTGMALQAESVTVTDEAAMLKARLAAIEKASGGNAKPRMSA